MNIFSLLRSRPRAASNFYRNLFAILAFAVFGAALLTEMPILFAAAAMLGALSRIAVRKGWHNPEFAERSGFLIKKYDETQEAPKM